MIYKINFHTILYKFEIDLHVNKPEHSSYPKSLGHVIRVLRKLGFQKCYPMFIPKQHYLNFRVPDSSGSGLGNTHYNWNYKKNISFNKFLVAQQ
jgi:hypothetical protein